ncbi:ComEA family DNA-binding protein [Paracholeplasma manati]|uniref:ComEA family DNA-binding protein n=1 Tax=Paracholeplasma manati TaxID=591373 RepID=A0ABT2Y7Q2_9MOLU|nr:ComEA family DNA-binding protein [Paracholeplasma manati]MCV2232020.1 ComEA family DNA-binding protein [Paracholeplasma manati]MDG0888826.1 ComEA family DNA-binding protein [Paracholeplasma manati]
MKKIIPLVLIILIIAGLLIVPRIQSVEKAEPVTKPTLIKVEIRGAVKMPGVYEVVSGTTLETLIAFAMGTDVSADLRQINLTAPLMDGVKYVIPTNTEETTDKININQATLEMLITLPGIGKVTAQRILDFRAKEGPFMRIEDIQLVSGIGAQTYENIQAFITI